MAFWCGQTPAAKTPETQGALEASRVFPGLAWVSTVGLPHHVLRIRGRLMNTRLSQLDIT
eukprot:6593636-Pyramimonas_sp.AAC.1